MILESMIYATLIYTQYRNIRNGGVFPVLDLYLKFPIFSLCTYSGFLALQGCFLNFLRFSLCFLKFYKKKEKKKKKILFIAPFDTY